ncbi:hypothetical protein ACFL42_01085 [Candidatus Omnitrophota bacterium]
MSKRDLSTAFLITALFLLNPVLSCAAEPQKAVRPRPRFPKMDFTYGEVVLLNGDAGSVIIRHYDCDSMQESDLEFMLGKETEWENAAGIETLRIGSWIGVNYIVKKDGTYMADSLRVDRDPPKGLRRDE